MAIVKRPGWHAIQATEFARSVYHPGLHACIPVFSPSHMYPDLHGNVVLVEALMYCPGGTAVQTVLPGRAVNLPAEHASHCCVRFFSSEAVFCGHNLHVIWPASSWYVEEMHGLHRGAPL